ncbi:GATA-like protein 1 [Heterocephalus glaber]|uniref:GATA-like protein 1 n=1 Tax=Heterocephalus glaber TaxID=10181 RepID=G5B229_HETGA|nr:GATA-like protein 1 [Heterocephalus glaber]
MEADPAQDLLRELLAPTCLDSEPSPGPSAQRQLRPLRCPRAGGRWDSVTILRLLQETEEGQARAPTPATQALGTCWEPGARRVSGPLTMARSSKNKQTPGSHKRRSRDPPGAPAALPQRRPRKQPKPRQGAKQVDPGFKGVTLKFQIKADSSLQISPTYSLASSSQTEGAASTPTRAAEPNSRGGEALGPRCCASCRTHRTPLWRDAEDGTPLCNACGIRYKKYGTRCSSCWLVPRKTVQPKKLCGRCGVSMGPLEGPPQAV